MRRRSMPASAGARSMRRPVWMIELVPRTMPKRMALKVASPTTRLSMTRPRPRLGEGVVPSSVWVDAKLMLTLSSELARPA